MKVKVKVKIVKGHSLEWGDSTWKNGIEKSIRNRYDNVETGRFNKFGSGEIPWKDFNSMVLESIKGSHFDNVELSKILKEISLRLEKIN